MYHYTICNIPDEELFYKQCAALEKKVPKLLKADFLEDVDGSLIQIYKKDTEELKVCNSEYIGALFIDSEFELERYFK